MTRRQLQQLKAARSSLAILVKNRTVWESLHGFAEQVGIVDRMIGDAAKLMLLQDEDRKGLASAKRKAYSQVVSLLEQVIGPCKVWAHMEGKEELKSAMSVNTTELQMLYDRLPERAEACLKNARICFEGGASRYGVTQNKLHALGEAIAELKKYSGAPRNASAERKTATSGLAEVISRLMAYLAEMMDPLVLQFKADHPQFASDYQNARRIGFAGRSKAKEGSSGSDADSTEVQAEAEAIQAGLGDSTAALSPARQVQPATPTTASTNGSQQAADLTA